MRRTERQTEIAFGASLLIALLVAIVVGETAVRLRDRALHHDFDWRAFLEAVTDDPDAMPFVRFRPGASFGPVSINALGYRGPDLVEPKPPGTLRLLFLGNSVFLGTSYPLSDTIPDQVSRSVAEASHTCRVDYLDMAGLRFELGYLTSLLLADGGRIDADVVVALGPSVREVLSAYERLHPRTGPLVRRSDWLSMRSRLWGWLSWRAHRLMEGRIVRTHGLIDRLDQASLRATVDNILVALLQASAGREVILVTASSDVRDWMTDAEKARRLAFQVEDTIGSDADDILALRRLIDKEIRRYATAVGWRVVDPIGALPPDSVNFADAEHPTAAGNRFVADMIADEVARDGRVRKRDCGVLARQ